MRYFIGFLITIGLIIVLIVLLFSGGNKSTPSAVPKLLSSYASTDAEVRLTIDGPINAAQSHQKVQITINSSQATFQQLQGYDGTVVNTQSYANTPNGYYAFLRALEQADFTKGNSSPALANDTGLCPLGDRYNMELIQNGNVLENYWTTTCGGLATFEGNTDLTLQLFQAQIPNYSNLTENINF